MFELTMTVVRFGLSVIHERFNAISSRQVSGMISDTQSHVNYIPLHQLPLT